MVSNLRSKAMTPEQEERRSRLLGAVDKALKAGEQYKGYTTPEEAAAHASAMKWLTITRGCFLAEPDRHDTHIGEILKVYGLREHFSDLGVRTLGDTLGKPLSRLEGYADQINKKIPFVLKALHAAYCQEPYRRPIPQPIFGTSASE
jgi:hypothetical protein